MTSQNVRFRGGKLYFLRQPGSGGLNCIRRSLIRRVLAVPDWQQPGFRIIKRPIRQCDFALRLYLFDE
jgi:hypothetical protein